MHTFRQIYYTDKSFEIRHLGQDTDSMGKIGYNSQMWDNTDGPSPNLFTTVVLLGDMQVGKSSLLTIMAGQKKASKITYRHCPLSLTTNVRRKEKTVQMKVRDTGGRLSSSLLSC